MRKILAAGVIMITLFMTSCATPKKDTSVESLKLGYLVLAKLPDKQLVEFYKYTESGKNDPAMELKLFSYMQGDPIKYDEKLAAKAFNQAMHESRKKGKNLMQYTLYDLPPDKSALVLRFLMNTYSSALSNS